MHVCVLLATYNGARHLREQLDSLFAQTHDDWRLLAADDGSDDATPALLADCARRYPRRVAVVTVAPPRSGPLRLFSRLIEHALATMDANGRADDYALALCDQDDVWHPQRLELGVERLRDASGAARLVHARLALIDAEGRTLGTTLDAHLGFDPRRATPAALLWQNVVSGCSALLTPALARASVPIPAAAVMHDWWLALTASLCDGIDYIDRPLVGYRQHGNNVFGAGAPRAAPALTTLPARLRAFDSVEHRARLAALAAQARWLRAHPPRPLTRRERLGCWLAARLAGRRPALRLLALKLLQRL